MSKGQYFAFLEAARLTILAILLAASVRLSCGAAQTPSDENWELGIKVLDADLSPSDQLVAVTTESPQNPTRGESVDEWLELWDLDKHRQLAKAHIATYVARAGPRTGPVRFTSDGKFVVVACAGAITVFDAATLNVVRAIKFPPGVGIRLFEISPASHTAVVASGGELFAVDLDSSHIQSHQFARDDATSIADEATSISWKPDGSQFAIALPAPCSNEGRVEIFGADPLARLRALHGKNLSAVAFSADHLYAVPDSFCKGSIFNRHLGMDVFNANTWKRERTLLLPHKDLHDAVSYANGRLLVDSGLVQTSFDALDLTTISSPANIQLTLWNGDAGSIIYESSALPINGRQLQHGPMRLSRTGHMAWILDNRVRIIQLP